MAGTDYDIIIVGAGPAGVSTWLHLHKLDPRLADRTLVIDKAVFPRHKLCGGGISAWSVELLDDLDIGIDIPRFNIETIRFITGEKSYTTNTFVKYVIDRKEFDNALLEKALYRGMQCNQGEGFITQSEKNGVLYITTDKHQYTAKVLVGADGSLSKVRSTMNFDYRVVLSRTLELYSPVMHDFDHECSEHSVTFDFSYVPDGLQGYVWHFPCIINGEVMMNHGIYDSRVYHNYPYAPLRKIFSRVLLDRGIDVEHCALQSWPITCFCPKYRLSDSRIILVGDAAGVDPFMGGGIHYALAYGNVAAREIVQSFKMDAGFSIAYDDAIQNGKIGTGLHDLNNVAKRAYKERNTQVLNSIVCRLCSK